jgi:transcriptional regulator with XRE-family HTH domain
MPSFDKSTFAHRLSSAIEESPLTQRQLATRIGAKPNRVSEWVNARGVPKLPEAVAAAATLGVSLDWLLTGEQGASPAEHKLVGELAGLAPSLSHLAKRARSLARR